jgi:carbon monoxide dehydrogenase subunit G
MKLEHKFTVPAPIETVWQALLDPERVAPCFPGATISSVSGDKFTGTVKIRLGPISLQYRGSGSFIETDETTHRTVIQATGTASGGQGTVAAKVHASLTENGEVTAVTVATDLTVTGKPAQFGRGLIEDVGGKIIGQFADCLSKTLGQQREPARASASPPSAAPQPIPVQPAPSKPAVQPASMGPASVQPASVQPASVRPVPAQPARAQPAPVRPVPPPMTEEIDLLDAAGPAVAKRAIPAIAAIFLLALVIRWLRRGRKQRSKTAASSEPDHSEYAQIESGVVQIESGVV